MSHLAPAEFVDAADGVLPAPRLAHLEHCRRCAMEMAAVRRTVDAARESPMPEPSPLYWSHLSARIREQVAAESIVPAWRSAFVLRRLAPIASALAVVAAVFASGLITRPARVVPASTGTTVAGAASGELGVEPDDSEAWDVLTSAAAETPIEDAHAAGMAVGAGAVDRAVQRLSPDELHELKRLLQGEMRRPGD